MNISPLAHQIYKLAKKVSVDMPFHATGIEKQLQEAISYEFRKLKNPIEAVREFYGEIYYKDYPIKDYRPDFLIFPNKEWSIDTTIIVETKFGTLKELATGREELFRYLYSAQQSSLNDIRNSNIGILIWWESIKTDTPAGNSQSDKDILLDLDTAEYVPPEHRVVLEVWKVEGKDRKKFKKILSY